MTDGVCLKEKEIVLGERERETDGIRDNTSLGEDSTFGA